MTSRRISRWQASAVHLGISVAIAAVAVALMVLVWYPPPLFVAEGGTGLLVILTGVDVVLGPLITLVVFRQGKPGMALDLAVIAALQAGALLYGMHVVYIARPAFLVYVQGQFEVARAVDLDPAELAKAKLPQFRSPPATGPVWAAAVMPDDQKERTELTLQALAGHDLQEFPRLWAPYEERRDDILGRAMTLEQLRKREPKYVAPAERGLADAGLAAAGTRFMLLRARQAWVVVLLDARTAAPLRMVIGERI